MKKKHLAWVTAICAAMAALFVYLPCLSLGFVNWDDDVYVYQNPHLEGSLPDVFTWAFTSDYASLWIPMTWLSLAMDHAIWGPGPFGFHLSNLLLHAINTLLVTLLAFVLLRRAAGDEPAAPIFAATVGFIFALHPLHVESVAWVTERKDLLYAFFWLFSIFLWLKHTARAHSRSLYLASLVFFMLSVMAKPMAVTLPVVLVILDFYPLQRCSWRKLDLQKILMEKAPFFLVALVGSVITFITAGSTGAMAGTESLTAIQRFLLACRGIGYYLGRFLLPVKLSPFYPLEVPIDLSLWTYSAGLVVLLFVSAICVAVLRRTRLALALWAYFLIVLLPVLGLFQAGQQAVADRFAYLALIAPAIGVGVFVRYVWLSRPGLRLILLASGLVALLACSWLTAGQIGVWKSSETMWQHVISLHPQAATAHYNLGEHFRDAGNLPEARRWWSRAIEIKPHHSQALNQMGNVALLDGDESTAEAYYRRSINSWPDNAEALYNLATIVERKGQASEALELYRAFVRYGGEEYGDLAKRTQVHIRALEQAGGQPD